MSFNLRAAIGKNPVLVEEPAVPTVPREEPMDTQAMPLLRWYQSGLPPYAHQPEIAAGIHPRAIVRYDPAGVSILTSVSTTAADRKRSAFMAYEAMVHLLGLITTQSTPERVTADLRNGREYLHGRFTGLKQLSVGLCVRSDSQLLLYRDGDIGMEQLLRDGTTSELPSGCVHQLDVAAYKAIFCISLPSTPSSHSLSTTLQGEHWETELPKLRAELLRNNPSPDFQSRLAYFAVSLDSPSLIDILRERGRHASEVNALKNELTASGRAMREKILLDMQHSADAANREREAHALVGSLREALARQTEVQKADSAAHLAALAEGRTSAEKYEGARQELTAQLSARDAEIRDLSTAAIRRDTEYTLERQRTDAKIAELSTNNALQATSLTQVQLQYGGLLNKYGSVRRLVNRMNARGRDRGEAIEDLRRRHAYQEGLLKQEISSLAHQLEGRTSDVRKLEDMVESLTTANQTLNTAVSADELRIAALVADLHSLNATYTTSREELNQEHQRAERFASEKNIIETRFGVATTALQERDIELAAVRADYDATKKELSSRTTEYEQARLRIGVLDGKVKRLTAESLAFKEKLKEERTHLRSSRALISVYEKDNVALTNQISALADQAEAAHSRHQQTAEELAQTKAALEAHESTLHEFSGALNQYQSLARNARHVLGLLRTHLIGASDYDRQLEGTFVRVQAFQDTALEIIGEQQLVIRKAGRLRGEVIRQGEGIDALLDVLTDTGAAVVGIRTAMEQANSAGAEQEELLRVAQEELSALRESERQKVDIIARLQERLQAYENGAKSMFTMIAGGKKGNDRVNGSGTHAESINVGTVFVPEIAEAR